MKKLLWLLAGWGLLFGSVALAVWHLLRGRRDIARALLSVGLVEANEYPRIRALVQRDRAEVESARAELESVKAQLVQEYKAHGLTPNEMVARFRRLRIDGP